MMKRVEVRASLLVRNTLVNVLGQGLPLLVAVFSLPPAVDGLGPDRFGVLALSWTILGYFGTLDLGLGRAATKFIAAALGRDAEDEIPRILGTALVVQGLFGIVGGSLLAGAAGWLTTRVFALPESLRLETVATLYIIAFAVPVVLISGSLRGALAAAQRFDLINAVTVVASSANFLLPALGVVAGWTLPVIVASLLASRVIATAAFGLLVARHLPGLPRRLSAERRTLGELLRFGSWVTVSALALPLLGQAERFLIPALLSVGALTFYAVPYETLSRVAILPTSVAQTLFPAFSYFEGRGTDALPELFARPLKYLLLIMTPVLAFIGVFAEDLLTLWVGRDFAAEAALPLQLLAAAFYLNSFAQVLLAAIQGLGRPDLKAKLDLVEAPLFLALLALLIPRFGIAGAAAAKLMVTLVDFTGLFWLVPRVGQKAFRPSRLPGSVWLGAAVSAALVISVATAAAVVRKPPIAYLSFASLTVLYFVVFWRSAMDATDRKALAQLRQRLSRGGAG